MVVITQHTIQTTGIKTSSTTKIVFVNTYISERCCTRILKNSKFAFKL